jgi:GT2 family glycosyltransferase
MAGIEDQDFAIRHTKNGGKIAYLPEAVAIHNDDWLDFFSFCRRQEHGMEWTVAFSRRYPDWTDSQLRDLINGRLRFGKEPFSISSRKILKSLLGTKLGRSGLAAVISWLEKTSPESRALNQFYKLMLGVHLQKGYRRGIRKYNSK